MKFRLILQTAIITLCLLSITSSFFKPKIEDHSKNLGHSWEEYDPSFFNRFQTVDAIIAEANRKFDLSKRNTLEYFNYIDELIRKRFYHGYSYYSMSDNPLAFLGGKIYSDLSAIVIPDDIMKHPMAACSQQSVVLMEIFKRCHVDYKKVGFDHHYATEARINNEWYFFDPNVEPKIEGKRESLEKLISNGSLDSVYGNVTLSSNDLHKMLGHPYYGKINATPAPRAELLHKFCFRIVSKYFLIPALLFLMIFIVPSSALYRNSLEKIYSLVRIPVQRNGSVKIKD